MIRQLFNEWSRWFAKKAKQRQKDAVRNRTQDSDHPLKWDKIVNNELGSFIVAEFTSSDRIPYGVYFHFDIKSKKPSVVLYVFTKGGWLSGYTQDNTFINIIKEFKKKYHPSAIVTKKADYDIKIIFDDLGPVFKKAGGRYIKKKDVHELHF